MPPDDLDKILNDDKEYKTWVYGEIVAIKTDLRWIKNFLSPGLLVALAMGVIALVDLVLRGAGR